MTQHVKTLVTLLAVPIIVLTGYVASAQPARSEGNALRGVWKITEISVTSPDTNWTTREPQPGLYIFFDTHYSTALIPENKSRPTFSDQTTDEERLAAFVNFVSNAGTYEVTGSTLAVRPMVAKVPSAMTGSGFSYEYSLEGDLLVLVLSAAWAPTDGKITYRLSRLE